MRMSPFTDFGTRDEPARRFQNQPTAAFRSRTPRCIWFRVIVLVTAFKICANLSLEICSVVSTHHSPLWSLELQGAQIMDRISLPDPSCRSHDVQSLNSMVRCSKSAVKASVKIMQFRSRYCAATKTSSSASFTDVLSGFSHRTCLPACSASFAIC